MLNFDPNQVVIYALVFVLGLLVGGFLFTGGGRKWKGKYNAEVERRKEIEARHVAAEKDWREQESLRNAAMKNRPAALDRDADRDGIDDRDQVSTGKIDRDGDGIDDRREI
jgi:hypothetical protein